MIAVWGRPIDDDRLQESLLANGASQFLQALIVKFGAWLVRIRRDHIDGQVDDSLL
jgi:hypothetical protein